MRECLFVCVCVCICGFGCDVGREKEVSLCVFFHPKAKKSYPSTRTLHSYRLFCFEPFGAQVRHRLPEEVNWFHPLLPPDDVYLLFWN